MENHNILNISKAEEFHRELNKSLPEYKLDTARDSSEGLKKLRENFFNIIILDSRIEDFPCENLIKKIINKNPESDLLIALGDPVERGDIFLRCGADDLLQLPLIGEEVRLKVKKLL